MAGKRRDHRAALVGAALALVLASPTPSLAGTKCKAGPVNGAGLSPSQATSNWSSNVRRAYGAAWANFGLARGKKASQTPLPASTLYAITATPCRRT